MFNNFLAMYEINFGYDGSQSKIVHIVGNRAAFTFGRNPSMAITRRPCRWKYKAAFPAPLPKSNAVSIPNREIILVPNRGTECQWITDFDVAAHVRNRTVGCKFETAVAHL